MTWGLCSPAREVRGYMLSSAKWHSSAEAPCWFTPPADLLQLSETPDVPDPVHKSATLDV